MMSETAAHEPPAACRPNEKRDVRIKKEPFVASTPCRSCQILSLALIVAVPVAAKDKPATAPLTAIHCGHLIDTLAGKVLGESTVIIEDRRVKEVSAGS